MIVNILKEAGYEEALLGLMLSFYDHEVPLLDWELQSGNSIGTARKYQQEGFFWTNERFDKAKKVALHLATKTIPEDDAVRETYLSLLGIDVVQYKYAKRNNLAYVSAEQKFLESMDVWVFVQASRSWWAEFDTYRIDTTKQSASTMHTLSKRDVYSVDFSANVSQHMIDGFNAILAEYNDTDNAHYHDVEYLKDNLPEGWQQERVVKTSYKTLKWILAQRDGHRLESWRVFNENILNQAEHPEFLKIA